MGGVEHGWSCIWMESSMNGVEFDGFGLENGCLLLAYESPNVFFNLACLLVEY